jgi:phenylalanyl-tRNA synthetase beta chain
MRVSLNWLKDYVDIDMPPDDLAHLLTMSSLEVEAVEPLGQSLEDIIVARILSVRRHPEADRLFVCQMDTGKGKVSVVCSAPNLEAEASVPMALPGTKLPGGMVVQESQIRGEQSVGMILAEDEMGLTDDHTGIMILPADLNPGAQVSSVLPLEDWAFEISITPNRPDCASVMGIAREIAALTGKKLKRPEIKIKKGETSIGELTSVTIDDPEGCPRYAAGMIQGVELKTSPFWLRYRLYVSGVRGINNVVDVHTLNNEILMICDGERSVAVAGIMGGLNSEIFAGSRNVLVESAYFDPLTIRRGSKRLGLATEASYRFERGIDLEGVTTALRRALMLISGLAGGEIVNGLVDNYPRPYNQAVIDLRIDKTNNFLGTSLSQESIARYLKALEMEVSQEDHNVIRVKPPAFRVDLTREVDLMEEVARLEGYDRIPVTSPAIRPSEEGDIPELVLRDRIREIVVGLGFTEVITYSFISPDSANLLDVEKESPLRSFVKLLNPLTVDQSVMRTSLVPGLLGAIKTNILHGEKDLNLFEWGKVFIQSDTDELPHEKPFLAVVMTGLIHHQEWYGEERNVDFYDIKGAAEGLLKGIGVTQFLFQREDIPPWYHPEVSAGIYLSGEIIGNVGQVLPGVLERYDLETKSLYLLELDIKALMGRITEGKEFRPFAKFPAVFRDISLIVERQVESAIIQDIIKGEGGELIESVGLYDLYEGEKIDSSEKALTFRICYRSKDGTLDGKEINLLHETIINKIRGKTGGRLREG